VSSDLIARLRQQWAALDPVDDWRADIAEAIETIEAHNREIEAALNLWPRDCRLCANYTTASGGCISTVKCVDSDQFRATAPRQYWKAVTP
jgi:hypothetical protein